MTKEKVENCKEEMAYDYDLQNELGELALVLDGISDLQAALWQAVCYGSLAGETYNNGFWLLYEKTIELQERFREIALRM